MKDSENRLKESCQEKGKDKDGKEGPEKTAEQQERDQEKQEKIPESKGTEWFLGLCFRLCSHLLYTCGIMTSLFIRQAHHEIYSDQQT